MVTTSVRYPEPPRTQDGVTPGLGYVSDSTIQTQSGYFNCVVLSHSMLETTPAVRYLHCMPEVIFPWEPGCSQAWIMNGHHLLKSSQRLLMEVNPWENKWSPWAPRELTVITVVTTPGPNDHGSVTARLGHSSVTARSQLSHGEVTAQSRRGHSSITVRSQLAVSIFSMITVRSRLGHSSITAHSRLAVTILFTVS